jgi:SOS-response transcriptional repressor LexA
MTVVIDRRLAEPLRLFLLRYAEEHGGQTPAINVMANEIGVTHNQVALLLIQLENKGQVHIISRRPLRVMVTTPGQKDRPGKPGSYERFLECDARRFRLARFIGETEHATGHGPSLRQMMSFVGSDSAAYVARMVQILEERGLMRDDCNRLSPRGREFFGFKQASEMERNTIVVIKSGRKPPNILPRDEKIEQVGTFVYDWLNKTGSKPGLKNVSRALNYAGSSAVRSVLDIMIAKGWIEPLPRFAKTGIMLTDKGRARFGPQVPLNLAEPQPETAPQSPPEAPPAAEPGPTLVGGASSDRAADSPPGGAERIVEQAHKLYHSLVNERHQPSLADFSDADLIIELNSRGFMVRRA